MLFLKKNGSTLNMFPYVLSKATVNILNYMPGNFGKYGGSQSKMFQYMASGRPICSNLKMMYCLINKYKLGIARNSIHLRNMQKLY